MRRSALLLAVLALSGCGSSTVSTPPAPTPLASPLPIDVTIRAGGFDPTVRHIFEGRTVIFINADGKAHAIFSDKHPAHDTCGGVLNVTIAPGAQRQVAGLPPDACFFHDESDPASPAFQGVLVIH